MKQTIFLVFILAFGVAGLSHALEDTWTYKADIPTARTWMGGCVLDGKIYVIGGGRSDSSATSAVEMYDPLVNMWTSLADIPSARCYPSACIFNGKIYVFGGGPGVWSSADKKVFLYDPQTNTWTQKTDMPYAIGGSGIVVVDNMIYLIGGALSASSPPVRRVMAYDPMTESWIQKADLPTARNLLSACLVDGKIYAIGGCKENWQTFAYKIVEVYDPSTNTWTSKQDMPTSRWSLGACVVKGSIYAIGGCSNGLQASTANEVYDPATDTWTAKAPMQQRRLGHFVGLVGDKIYAIGGHYPSLIMVPKTEEYDVGLSISSPDINGDGIVDCLDMCIVLDHWGENYPLCDIGPMPWGDGIVDVQDLIILADHLFEGAGLVAHWALDETEGDIAYDSAGNLDAAVYNGQWTAGKVGGALLFNGLTTYMDCGDSLRFGTRKMTISMWLEPEHMGGMRYVLSRAREGAEDFDYVLMRYYEDQVELAVAQEGSEPVSVMSNATTPLNEWTHVAVSMDGSEATIYINGQLDASAGYGQRGSYEDCRLWISSLGGDTRFYNGKIDDVRIYNISLSAEEIEQLAQ
jgi:N-acetylneuraminic acid mutarotase